MPVGEVLDGRPARRRACSDRAHDVPSKRLRTSTHEAVATSSTTAATASAQRRTAFRFVPGKRPRSTSRGTAASSPEVTDVWDAQVHHDVVDHRRSHPDLPW